MKIHDALMKFYRSLEKRPFINNQQNSAARLNDGHTRPNDKQMEKLRSRGYAVCADVDYEMFWFMTQRGFDACDPETIA